MTTSQCTRLSLHSSDSHLRQRERTTIGGIPHCRGIVAQDDDDDDEDDLDEDEDDEDEDDLDEDEDRPGWSD